MIDRRYLIVAVVSLITLAFILRLVRRRQMRAKYSVLWVGVAAGLIVLLAWPGLLQWLADRTGVDYPPAVLALFGGAFVLLLTIHFSWEISRLEERTRVLAEEHALLSEELRRRDSG